MNTIEAHVENFNSNNNKSVSVEQLTLTSTSLTYISLFITVLGFLSLYARFQQIDATSSLSTILLCCGFALISFGAILFFVKPDSVQE